MKQTICSILFFLVASHGNCVELAVWGDPPGFVIPYVGHAWIELTDEEGEVVSYEFYSRGMVKNQAIHHSFSILHTWEISQEKADRIIEEMEKRCNKKIHYNLLFKNCVHMVKKAMSLADIPHPDFVGLSFAASPCKLCHYLDLLNDGLEPREIADLYLNYPEIITPVGTKHSLRKLA